MDLFDQVAAAIAKQMNIDVATIKPESRLIEDLKADSLDLVVLVMDLETAFEKEIPDEDLEHLKTVQDILNFLDKK